MSVQTVKSRYHLGLRGKEALAGYLLLSPWLIGIVLFIAGPMITSAYLSFTRYDIVNPPEWLGFKNYVDMFTKDRLFWTAIQLTFRYAIILVPSALFGSLMA